MNIYKRINKRTPSVTSTDSIKQDIITLKLNNTIKSNNTTRNQKYSFYSFLIICTFRYFRYFGNLYFLLIASTQLFKPLKIGILLVLIL